MKREVKFRGKDCKNEWVYGDLIHKRHDKSAVMIQDCDGLGSDVNPDTVGEFTGMRDKNGGELWEGYIVEFTIYDYNGFDTQRKGIIEYANGCFGIFYRGIDDELFYPLYEFSTEDIEAIGDIHDNPELLK